MPRTAGAGPQPSREAAVRWPMQRMLGLAICLAGAAALLHNAALAVAASPALLEALRLGSLCALATGLGAVPLALLPAPSLRTQDALLGAGAGVMLAAACFSLLLPAIQAASSWPLPARVVGVGGAVLLGAGALLALERWMPHLHVPPSGPLAPQPSATSPSTPPALDHQRLARAGLMTLALVLHNIPEGAAVGVAVAGLSPDGAAALTFGIAAQNVMEGLVIALALRSAGLARHHAMALAAVSGLVEPLAAVLAAAFAASTAGALPFGLAAAAGAMLFVVSHEVIPESHRQGHEGPATAGLMIGFVCMLGLVQWSG